MTKSDDWWRCLKRLMDVSATGALAQFGEEAEINAILSPVGLAVSDMDVGDEQRRRLLIPARSDQVDELFAGTEWDAGRYFETIRGGPAPVVIKARSGIQMTIGNKLCSVVLVDLAAWQAWLNGHRPAAEPELAAAELKQFVERIERLEEDKKAVSDDIKDVYAEAKGRGFHTPAIRAVVRLRAQDPATREEEEAMVELYKNALGMT